MSKNSKTRDFATELRVYKAVNRLTQEEIGSKIGCSATIVSQIERGLIPSPELKKKLEQLLDAA